MKYIILLLIVFLVSCNPCKQVARHPECFPADTVIINNEVIHHEKVFITNDSIVRDTVPCDPILKTYYKTNTVYKTNYKEITDTIYQSKEVSKINPVNAVLKSDNEKLTAKNKRKNKFLIGSLVLLIICGVIIYIK